MEHLRQAQQVPDARRGTAAEVLARLLPRPEVLLRRPRQHRLGGLLQEPRLPDQRRLRRLRPGGGCQRINYAPVFVSPTMQWAVPNSCLSGPPAGPRLLRRPRWPRRPDGPPCGRLQARLLHRREPADYAAQGRGPQRGVPAFVVWGPRFHPFPFASHLAGAEFSSRPFPPPARPDAVCGLACAREGDCRLPRWICHATKGVAMKATIPMLGGRCPRRRRASLAHAQPYLPGLPSGYRPSAPDACGPGDVLGQLLRACLTAPTTASQPCGRPLTACCPCRNRKSPAAAAPLAVTASAAARSVLPDAPLRPQPARFLHAGIWPNPRLLIAP